MKIQLYVDSTESWMYPYAKRILNNLIERGHDARIVYKDSIIEKGDILFLLACSRLFKQLDLNTHTLVVHSSFLPEGRGWSPMTWQVLQGKSVIPNTLFEATPGVDEGEIYLQNTFELSGYELLDELKAKQGNAIVELIDEYISNYLELIPTKQEGTPTYYPKRLPRDSKLDINKTIKEQFNLLRVCDNRNYPAFFEIGEHKYLVKIEKVQ